MAQYESRDQRYAEGAGETAGGTRPNAERDHEAKVDRIVNDVKDGVDRVAAKVKDLLRSNR